MSPRASTLCVLAALSASCSFRNDLPQGLRLRCDRDSDCPQNHVCNQDLKLCATPFSPLTGPATVTPSLARAGDTLTASFVLASAARSTPRVWLVDAKGNFGAEWAVKAADGSGYQASMTVVGTEAEGLAHVVADIVGAGGDLLLAPLGAVTLDFTAPKVVSSSLVLTPAPGNELAVLGLPKLLTAMNAETSATLTLAVDEALAAAPAVTVIRPEDGGALGVAPATSDGLAWTIAPPPASPDVDGVYDVQAGVVDRAGNRRQVSLGTIDVKTTAPTPPAVNTPDAVFFRRAPSGTLDVATPSYALRGSAGAAEPRGAVKIFFSGAVIAHALTDLDGGFAPESFSLNVDPDSVEVAAVDRAGNSSSRVMVRDIEWVATMREAPGVEDGGRLILGEARPDAIAGPRSELVDQLQPGDVTLADFVTTSFYRGSAMPPMDALWRNATTACVFRTNHGLIGYADSREGVSSAGDARVSSGCVPGSAYAFDWTRKALVRVQQTPTQLATTTTPSRPDGGELPRRVGVALAWSPAHGGLLAFGGTWGPTNTFYSDTWRLDDTGWSRLGGVTGPALTDATLAWDNAASRMLLFGGRQADGGSPGATYALTDGGWVALSGATLPPGWGRAATTSLADETLLTSGGVSPSGGGLAETWRWAGDHWSAVPQGELPAGMAQNLLYWDARLQSFVVADVQPASSSVGWSLVRGPWTLADAGWTSLGLRDGGALPSPYVNPSFGVDVDAGRIIRVGGYATDSNCDPDTGWCYYLTQWAPETWALEGDRWTRLAGSTFGQDAGPLGSWNAPRYTSSAALAWNPNRGHLTAESFDGQLYELVGDDWQPVPSVPPIPASLSESKSLAWDPTYQTWTTLTVSLGLLQLRGGAWVHIGDAPPPGASQLMGTTTFGGLVGVGTALSRWTGFWAPLWTGPGSTISAGLQAAETPWGLVHDLFSTGKSNRYVIAPDGTTTFASGGSGTYLWQPHTQRLFSHLSCDKDFASWQELDPAAGQPAQLWSVALAKAHIPSGVLWSSAAVRARAGGRGADSAGTVVDGARLFVSLGGWYRPVADWAGSTVAPTVGTWTSRDGAVLARLLSSESTLGFAVQASSPSGPGRARVTTSQAEMVIGWRRP